MVYELRKMEKEVTELVKGITLGGPWEEPDMVESFDDLDAALAALKNYETDIRKLSGAAGSYYLVTEYYIEDENGNVYEITDMPEEN